MTVQPKLDAAPLMPRIEDPAPFSESERVIYSKNPLESVICQLRFPTILKISSEPPVEFQESLRKGFPIYREILPTQIAPPELSSLVGKLIAVSPPKAYEFTSPDNEWQLTLTHESLALLCTNYKRWEQFIGNFKNAMRLLERIYEPPFFTRIGLRYRDVIVRSQLNLASVQWSELLSKDLVGELHSSIAGSIETAAHQLSLRLQGCAKVTLQHGLGNKEGEVCYIIDSDFYTDDRTGAQDADGLLAYFNRQAGRLFKWCIAERLHRAMEPLPVR